MSDINWRIVEQKQAFNTAVDAAGREQIIAGTYNVDAYNSLEVMNSDAVGIQILLDNDSTRAYNIDSKIGFILKPEEGQVFKTVVQVNRDGVTAETANAILFKAMKKVEV